MINSTDPVHQHQALLRAYEAALAIASELRIDAVLQKIVDLAREIVPAKYAALGVCDDEGRIIHFITSGIDPETVALIGPTPHGKGLLGALIREGKPLLVPDIAADPRSVGFPPHHPPMHSLLGVPIQHGGRTLGDLYLTERLHDTAFTNDDLVIIQVLAAHAATAIERANLHQRAEENQRRAEEQRDQLQVILDSLPSGILIQSAPEGRNELVNQAAFAMIFADLPPSDALPVYGRDYRLTHADGTSLSSNLIPGLRALRGETVRNQQFMLERADGRTLPILAQAAPLRKAGGIVSGAVIVWQDITKLREAEQLKDDFLSLVSHEFRTPLTAINGGAQLLAHQGHKLDEKMSHELLVDIMEESTRLDRMLGNMLSAAAIMAGRLQPETEPVLIEPLVRKVVADFSAHSPDHAFLVDLPADLPPAEGDAGSLVQILRNLYENAVKYAPGGGQIRTSARFDDWWITLNVIDTGVGIAANAVPHVFERFRRPGADATIRGMGLGLYLSRMLIEAQGGHIFASSPGPGKGATFSIVLPIVAEAADHDNSNRERAS